MKLLTTLVGLDVLGPTYKWTTDVFALGALLYRLREGVTPVAIPMLGLADSLNVSASAAVLFYEARRQRRAAGT